MFKPKDLYIDLGTANTLIYQKGKGMILNQPSILAARHRKPVNQPHTTQLIGLGNEAKQMLGKNPDNVTVLRPLRDGVIADFSATTNMLYEFLKSMDLHKVWNKPRMIISLPCEVTQFEKRAVEEAGRDIGARYVHLLDEPVAAAIGAGLPVTESRGSMLVDIGGGTTEIAVISLGGIVTSRAVRLGGYSIDQVLIHHLRHQYRFEIGEQTAEKLKIEAGSALPNVTRFGLVGGLDLQTGLPKRRAVSSKLIYEAINSVISDIIIEIKKSLEAVPPEISGDIAEDGIVLAGGGALLNGLRERIELETGVPVRVADSPLISVAKGGAMALENNKLFDMLKRPA